MKKLSLLTGIFVLLQAATGFASGYLAKVTVANEICVTLKDKDTKIVNKELLGNKISIETHNAGCKITEEIAKFLSGNQQQENEANIKGACDGAYQVLDLNNERVDQGKAAMSEADIKFATTNMGWLKGQFDKYCNVTGVPRFATVEKVLRAKIMKDNL